MRYIQFRIQNFKGIEDITIQLDRSPHANVYTLVGLNESGKTTILEAINFFNIKDSDLNALDLPGAIVKDYNSIIPISKRDNFNGKISIEVWFKPDEEDFKKFDEIATKKTSFEKVVRTDIIKYFKYYKYKDSKFDDYEVKWSGLSGFLKTQPRKSVFISDREYAKDNLEFAGVCNSLVPSILYFPNFLFDFPSKISLESKEQLSEKDEFYLELIQDILFSLGNDASIKTHIIERVKSEEASDKRNLNSLLQKMSRKVTQVVFDAWNTIFKRKLTDTRVVIDCNIDTNGHSYLEFNVEAQDGIYNINERSLGFRWFFIFLLFTQFRPFRKDTPSNVIFLFDEPASNLHSSAQSQLLKSFENLTKNSKVIYTTHSHHLINPDWLESTYVVKNEGLKLEDPDHYNIKQTSISITPYRDFVTTHPYNTAYFQPILDVLDYAPSNLEMVPHCIFLEGKNDYYILSYFQSVIFKDRNRLNFAPSTGSGNLDTLISLYLAWGKDFVVLLDSDKAGVKEKSRYIEKFGILLEKRIFLLEDIDLNWRKREIEKLLDDAETIVFTRTVYPESSTFNKTHFNRAVQEKLINNSFFEFSENTKTNFSKVLEFLFSQLIRK